MAINYILKFYGSFELVKIAKSSLYLDGRYPEYDLLVIAQVRSLKILDEMLRSESH